VDLCNVNGNRVVLYSNGNLALLGNAVYTTSGGFRRASRLEYFPTDPQPFHGHYYFEISASGPIMYHISGGGTRTSLRLATQSYANGAYFNPLANPDSRKFIILPQGSPPVAIL
jgi:hypothetical protein